MTPMTPRLVPVLLLAFLLASPPARAADDQAAADGLAARLEKARSTYQQKVERFKADLLKDLDAKENQARAKGDKKLLDQVKAERAAFTERGTLPRTVSTTTYESRVRQARGDVESTYAAAIKELIRDKQDDRAAAVEAQLAAFRKEADGAAGVVDMLEAVDLAQDVIAGRWSRDGRSVANSLESRTVSYLRLPYSPPNEYELEVRLTRVRGENDIMFGLPLDGRRFIVMLDGYGSSVSGIHAIDGRGARENESTVKARFFTNGQPATVVVRTTRQGVLVTIDGKPALKYAGPPDRLGGGEERKVPPGQPFLAMAPNALYKVDAVRLRPISGQGKPIR